MNRTFCIFLVWSGLLLGTACRYFGPQEYSFSPEDTGKTLDAHTGDLIRITLPADPDELRPWKIASPHSPAVLMRFDTRYGNVFRGKDDPDEEKPVHAVQYFYRIIGPGFSGISFERKGKMKEEGGRAPNERFNLLVRAEGERTTPEDIFKGDAPPETMTDSKGNVVPTPRNLLDKNTKPLKKREKTEPVNVQ